VRIVDWEDRGLLAEEENNDADADADVDADDDEKKMQMKGLHRAEKAAAGLRVVLEER
jgi:hypothetical protein